MTTRIAINFTPAMTQTAGIGRYTRGIVEALALLPPPPDTEFRLFVAGRLSSPHPWPSHITWRVLPIAEQTLTRLWHRLHIPIPAEWLTGPIDLYHSPDYVLPPLHHAIGVVTIHDLSFLRVPECADPKLRAFLTAEVPQAVRRARHILADSESTRRDLIDLLGVSPEKISVVPAGISPDFRRVVDEARLNPVRIRYGLPQHFILSLGRLEPRKNFVRLIQAYAHLRKHLAPPHHLVIAGGRGWLYEEIFREPERLGISEWVHFIGFVPDDDLPALYSLADVFAFPSLYEGFGIPPLEALACGTPTVVADNSSLPEVVGDAALTVPAEDVNALAEALARLIQDDAWRERTRRSGPEQARHFTWEAAARRLLAAYQQALGGEAS
ncbi:MAG: glycosyltransferase family 4 protein [Anaerolineae bacterium]|nr:glycosyltransferase family 4 protein [Anaerolineae bacterium]